jgi:cytochrome oxidase Cu insertion factor (SCO1/SenC/PrrC family)
MNAGAVSVPAAPGAGRRTLLLILALFVLPVLIAAGLYLSGWQPGRTMNHGELLKPAFALPQGLNGVDGKPLPADELHGKWLLLLAGSGPCDDACRALLQQMHSVQVALNKERNRIRRAWINPGAATDPALPELQRLLPDMLVAQPADGAWGAAFGTAAGHRLYLADPMGNVILRYPDNADPQGVRRDLERLLKYSWIG